MKNKNDIETMRLAVEAVGIDNKLTVDETDMLNLSEELEKRGEPELAYYIDKLKKPEELEDLLVNVIYP